MLKFGHNRVLPVSTLDEMARVVFILFLFCLITSCNTDALSTLRVLQYETRWRAQHINAYDYTFRLYCNCPEEMMRPARVLVRNDIVTAARYLDTGEFVRNPEVFARYISITDLFQDIGKTLEQGIPVTVRYNPRFGNPEQVTLGFVDTTSQTDYWRLYIENLLVIH
jgi:hypothetical protein